MNCSSIPTHYRFKLYRLHCQHNPGDLCDPEPNGDRFGKQDAYLCRSFHNTHGLGSGAHLYTWNGSSPGSTLVVSPVTSTVYTVSGTNTITNCPDTETISISVFTKTISVSASTTICKGSSVTISASGASTYTWSTGAQVFGITVSPATSTVYVVDATTPTLGMNCPSSGTVNITVNPTPTVIATAERTLMCKGEVNTISASGAVNYTWSAPASTNASFTIMPSGSAPSYTYLVTGSDNNNCQSTGSVVVKVNSCNGITELQYGPNGKILIYPNPSGGDFTITSISTIDLNLVNELGEIVRTIHVPEHGKAAVTNLANGVYFIVTKDSIRLKEKIIVNR